MYARGLGAHNLSEAVRGTPSWRIQIRECFRLRVTQLDFIDFYFLRTVENVNIARGIYGYVSRSEERVKLAAFLASYEDL